MKLASGFDRLTLETGGRFWPEHQSFLVRFIPALLLSP